MRRLASKPLRGSFCPEGALVECEMASGNRGREVIEISAEDSRGSGRNPRQRRRQAEITTRSGDDGYTGLLGKERVPKWHPRPESFGTLDEATSALGLARALTPHAQVREHVLVIQRQLYLVMAELATGVDDYERSPFKTTPEQVLAVEAQTEALKLEVDLGREFVIPGETAGGAAIDLARTIVRRGERTVAKLLHDGVIANWDVLRLLNRLSDVLFVLARVDEALSGKRSRPSKETAPPDVGDRG
jgi:cob(I)alamin adenosyltransferase